MMHPVRRGFTLVEILVVVVILGILAAIVVPLFRNATGDAEVGAATEALGRARRILMVYYVRNGNAAPNIISGGSGLAAWGEMGTEGYLKEAPKNPWVGEAASRTVIVGSGPDTGYQTTHGWIYRPPGPGLPAELWAGGFDAQDQPFPRP